MIDITTNNSEILEKMGRERQVFWDKRNKGEKSPPDNYVDKKLFLSLLKRNEAFQPYSYKQLVYQAFSIVMQMNLILFILLLFISVQHIAQNTRKIVIFRNRGVVSLLWMDEFELYIELNWVDIPLYVCDLFMGILSINNLYGKRTRNRTVSAMFQNSILFLMLFLFTPILRSLTETYSTNTVYELAFVCGVLHLYSFDYLFVLSSRLMTTSNAEHPTEIETDDERDSKYTEPNCTLAYSSLFLLSLLLASRLNNDVHAFLFLIRAVACIVIYPHFSRYLRVVALESAESKLRRLTEVLPILVPLTATALCLPWLYLELNPSLNACLLQDFISTGRKKAGQMEECDEEGNGLGFIAFYLITTAFISLIGPMFLLHLQQYKDVIHGPWDILEVPQNLHKLY